MQCRLEGSGEGGEGENRLQAETVEKIYCVNITFKYFFNVGKFLMFRILPVKCIVTYFTDINMTY